MPLDWSDFEVLSDTEVVSLLLSERSQQIVLSALASVSDRPAWLDADDATWDDIDASVAEAYEEIMRSIMPDFTPVGTVSCFFCDDENIPDKWILCAGQTIELDDYPELCDFLPIAMRIDSNTWQLPDLRSRFIYGASIDADIGDTGGSETHTLAANEIPPHVHTIPRSTTAGAGNNVATGNNAGATSAINTGTLTAALAHNNMPPYIYGYWCIKATP